MKYYKKKLEKIEKNQKIKLKRKVTIENMKR
jgi:hypothetical protein